MPTGTKIATIVIVLLLGVAGLYYMTTTPAPRNASATPSRDATTNATTTTAPPTLTMAPGTTPGTTPGTAANTATNGTTPTPTGVLPNGTTAARPLPPFTPSGATNAGATKDDAAPAIGNPTAANTNPAGAAGTIGATNTTPTAMRNGMPLRTAVNATPGTTGGSAVANAPSGTHAGGPTPTSANNPNGAPTIANNTNTNTAGNNVGGTTTAANALGERTHVIASGDTFGALAKKFYGSEAKWEVIAKANPLVTPDRLKIGQKIRIPASATASAGTTEGAIAANTTTNAPNTVAANNGGSSHVVAKGETLSSISRKYYGSDKYWKQILTANKGTTEKNLRIGQKLTIPSKTTVAGGENVGGAGT